MSSPTPGPAPVDSSPPAAGGEPGESSAELAQAMTKLAATVARLRGPGGCAWDAEQTHASLVPYLREEAAEAAAAARAGEPAALRDELGDVLLQVVLHAQIAAEARTFDLAAVARNLDEKLVRRHPHVFAGAHAADGAAAEALWEEQKAAECAQQKPQGALEGVPEGLPALQRTQKVARRAGKVGFDWPDVAGPLAKLDEEIGEVKEALEAWTAAKACNDAAGEARTHAALSAELGDALFSLVNLARHVRVDAEEALHATVARFLRRFAHVEAELKRRGLSPEPAHVDLMGELWHQAKRILA